MKRPQMGRVDMGAYEVVPPYSIYLPLTLKSSSPATPYYQATFDGPGCEWSATDNSYMKLGCVSGEYQTLVKPINGEVWKGATSLNNADFDLVADVRFASSATGSAALFFNDIANDFYLFMLNSSGRYSLKIYTTGLPTLIGWRNAPGFNTTGSNRLKIRRQGAAISLYLNGQFLTTVNDATLNGHGIGVYVNAYQANFDVRWDNFAAYPAGGAP